MELPIRASIACLESVPKNAMEGRIFLFMVKEKDYFEGLCKGLMNVKKNKKLDVDNQQRYVRPRPVHNFQFNIKITFPKIYSDT